MRRMRWFFLITASYFAFLLFTAPASLISLSIAYFTDHHLVLKNPTGGLWKGQGTLAVWNNERQEETIISPVQWEIAPLYCLIGQIRSRVWLNSTNPPAKVDFSLNKLYLQNIKFSMPIKGLKKASKQLEALQPEGHLVVNIDELLFQENKIKGSVSLDWLFASTALSAVNPIGDYRIQLKGLSDKIGIELTTLNGPFIIAGQGQWQYRQGVILRGKANVSPQDRDQWIGLLRFMGVAPDSDSFILAIPVQH